MNKEKKRKMICLEILCFLLIFLLFCYGNKTYEFMYDKNQSEEQLVDTIKTYVETNFNRIGSSGISVGLVNDKEVMMQNQYGVACADNEQYVLGSISKSFTALGIMQLVDEGKIDLDNTVGYYLKDDEIYCEEMQLISVKQLLYHTSGVGVNDIVLEGKKLKDQGSFQYSNLNYNLLGKIIENVSGLLYSEYMEQNIFEPLEMNYSVANLDQADCSGYQSYFGLLVKKENNSFSKRKWIKEPSGYLVSTPNDMNVYLQLYLNDGKVNGKKIISEESIHEIFTFEEDATNDEVSGGMMNGKAFYGMGWICKNAGEEKIYFHSGKVKNFNSMMVLLPKRNYGLVILGNTGDFLVGTNLFEQMSEGVVQIILGETVKNINPLRYIARHLLLDWIMFLITQFFVIQLVYIFKFQYGTIVALSKLFCYLFLCIFFIAIYAYYWGNKKISLVEILDFIPDIWYFLNINCFVMGISCITIVYKLIHNVCRK